MENKSYITWSHAHSRWKQSTESPLGAPGRGQIRGLCCAVRTTMVLHAQIIPLRVPRS